MYAKKKIEFLQFFIFMQSPGSKMKTGELLRIDWAIHGFFLKIYIFFHPYWSIGNVLILFTFLGKKC